MTKFEAPHTLSTFATFRLSGDQLDPLSVSGILGASPTIAYRKSERYFAGLRTGKLEGRTGVWYLSTERLVSGLNPIEHLSYLIGLLGDKHRQTALKELMARDNLKADASLFWHGSAGAREPEIPREIEEAFQKLPAHLERDFDSD